MTETSGRVLWTMRILSAIALLAAGGIHIYEVFNGTGGILGVMFTLNGIAGLVLAIGMLVLHGRLLQLATVLGLLFLIATVGSLLLALTVGLFGIHQSWDYPLVAPTLIIESIGIVILAITTVLVMRMPVGQPAMRRGA